MIPPVGILALVLGGILALVAASLRRVPEGHSYTVNRLGRYHRTLGPGWHVLVPLADRITHRLSTAGSVLKVDYPSLTTSDRQPVAASGRVFLQVVDPRKVAYLSGDLKESARELGRRCSADLVAQQSLAQLQRYSAVELNGWMRGRLNQTSLEWGVRVTRVELSFAPDPGHDQTA